MLCFEGDHYHCSSKARKEPRSSFGGDVQIADFPAYTRGEAGGAEEGH